MRPHPRIRKMVMWGASLLTVLLVAVWIWSRWYGAYFLWRNANLIGICRGHLYAQTYEGRARWSRSQWGVVDAAGFASSWEFAEVYSLPHRSFIIPLWQFCAVTSLISAFAWRLDTRARRRARLGCCPACGYSRTGLAPERPCPECGAAAPPLPPAAT